MNMVKFASANDPDYRIAVSLIYQIQASGDRTKHAQELQALQLKSKSYLLSD